MLVHGSNLLNKEKHTSKYLGKKSRLFLTEIREMYDEWHSANNALMGPFSTESKNDYDVIVARVALLKRYKDFLDQQPYAEHFDSRANLHSSVIEEFLYYLFRDLVQSFGGNAVIGKSHAFKDIFFVPSNYKSMTKKPYTRIELKDHDFIIGVTLQMRIQTLSRDEKDEMSRVSESSLPDGTHEGGNSEIVTFDVAAVAIECKTYLDKTMLEGASRAAEELKARHPKALYLVVMEWLKLTSAVNLRKYAVDQIYVLRKQKNTDREFRFADDYIKNSIDVDVVWHLFSTVRRHLTIDWETTIEEGLARGWLLE